LRSSREPETSDSYLARVRALINDSGTHIYFDTSFLGWLAKLGRSARSQFFAWTGVVGTDRFHVPLWSAHEFFKHQMEDSFLTEFNGQLNTFDAAAQRLLSLCRFVRFGRPLWLSLSREQFLSELQTNMQRIRTILEIAKKKVRMNFIMDRKEVAAFIDVCLIDTFLPKVLARIEAEERVRNRGRIPPSFQDAYKRGPRSGRPPRRGRGEPWGDNSFGDLVIWKETLRHAKEARASAVIIATNDRKNDWYVNFRGGQSVAGEIRQLSPNIGSVPEPHPLLQKEARCSVPIGGLTLIDPPIRRRIALPQQ